MQRPFAGQMTAAGKIAPAKVLVVGAGVAGAYLVVGGLGRACLLMVAGNSVTIFPLLT
jgi:NAD/NADP transhydrogenase alpha subunit